MFETPVTWFPNKMVYTFCRLIDDWLNWMSSCHHITTLALAVWSYIMFQVFVNCVLGLFLVQSYVKERLPLWNTCTFQYKQLNCIYALSTLLCLPQCCIWRMHLNAILRDIVWNWIELKGLTIKQYYLSICVTPFYFILLGVCSLTVCFSLYIMQLCWAVIKPN